MRQVLEQFPVTAKLSSALTCSPEGSCYAAQQGPCNLLWLTDRIRDLTLAAATSLPPPQPGFSNLC